VSFGKRMSVIILLLFLCSVLVVCGLAAAEYHTRIIGFGEETPPVSVEHRPDGQVWLRIQTLGIQWQCDLNPVIRLWEKVETVIAENFRGSRKGSFFEAMKK